MVFVAIMRGYFIDGNGRYMLRGSAGGLARDCAVVTLCVMLGVMVAGCRLPAVLREH